MEISEFATSLERFKYYKAEAGCDDAAASILTLADTIRSLDLGGAIEWGLDNGHLRVSADLDGTLGVMAQAEVSKPAVLTRQLKPPKKVAKSKKRRRAN